MGTGGEPEGISRPSGADLIADLLPFDRGSLVRAVDEFLRQLDDLNLGPIGMHGPMPFILLSVTLASTATAMEVVRRLVQRAAVGSQTVPVRDPRERADYLAYPELPGSWSERSL
jgi:hypothetical protein